MRQTEADFDAPHVEFTPSSSWSRRTSRNTWVPAVRHCADRHDQRVDDDVLLPDPVVGGPVHDSPSHLEPDVGVLGDSRLVVRDRHDRRPVLGDERQHPLEAFLLAGHRVDQPFPL